MKAPVLNPKRGNPNLAGRAQIPGFRKRCLHSWASRAEVEMLGWRFWAYRTLGLRFRFRAVRGFGGPCWGFRFKDGLEDQGLESTPKSANAILTGAR